MQLLTFTACLVAAALLAIAKIILATSVWNTDAVQASLPGFSSPRGEDIRRATGRRRPQDSQGGKNGGVKNDHALYTEAAPRHLSPNYSGEKGGNESFPGRPRSEAQSTDSILSRRKLSLDSVASSTSTVCTASTASTANSGNPRKIRFLEIRNGVFVQREIDPPTLDETQEDGQLLQAKPLPWESDDPRGGDNGERAAAATWALQRGMNTDVGLEDFERRSLLGRAIRKLRGPSRRSKSKGAVATAARAHVVKSERDHKLFRRIWLMWHRYHSD